MNCYQLVTALHISTLVVGLVCSLGRCWIGHKNMELNLTG